MVLIQKNDEESRLPVRWPWSKRGQGKIGEQSQSLRSRLWQVFLRLFVVYGYKPSRALIIGSAFILAGWLVFYNGFDKSLMVPVEKAGSYSHYLHQVGKLSVSNPTAAGGGETAVEKKTIKDGLGLYAFVYTLDTFVPILDFGTAGNWLPNSYPPQQEGCSGFGLFLCIYRWLLIACGWVVTSVYVAALSGLVRR